MGDHHLAAVDVSALRLLVDIADTGSLSAAARRARITQPSASQAVRRLERRLGLTLLIRTPSGSRTTPAGARLVATARQALAALDTVAGEAAALRATARLEVRVAASYTCAEYVLPQRLPERVKTILAVLNSEEVVARVRSHDADVGFIEGPADLSGLRVRRVLRDELVVIVAPGHPWIGSAHPLAADVLAATPLLLRETGSGTRSSYEQALRRKGLFAATPLGVLSSTEALKAAVRVGVGASVLSRLAVAEDLAGGRLAEVPVSGLDLRRDLRAIWLPRHLSAAASAFLRAAVPSHTGG